MCKTKEDIARHNKAVDEERKAYHERRCKESENYKRVCENMEKVKKYAHSIQNQLCFLDFVFWHTRIGSPKIKDFEPIELKDEDAPFYEEYFKVESDFYKRIILPDTPDR